MPQRRVEQFGARGERGGAGVCAKKVEHTHVMMRAITPSSVASFTPVEIKLRRKLRERLLESVRKSLELASSRSGAADLRRASTVRGAAHGMGICYLRMQKTCSSLDVSFFAAAQGAERQHGWVGIFLVPTRRQSWGLLKFIST